MQEIRCPKCGEVFQVDETGYEQIAHQVRDKEFAKELDRREKELESKMYRLRNNKQLIDRKCRAINSMLALEMVTVNVCLLINVLALV